MRDERLRDLQLVEPRLVFPEVLQRVRGVKGIGVLRVWESYGEQVERKLNVTVVDVTTVVPLDDHLREVITKKSEADLGTKVVLRESIDKSLIGGILMSANGKRIDASMTSQLEAARNVLKHSTDGGEC